MEMQRMNGGSLARKTTVLKEIQLRSPLVEQIKELQVRDDKFQRLKDKIEVGKKLEMVVHSNEAIIFKKRLST